jgi:hypothetical protein
MSGILFSSKTSTRLLRVPILKIKVKHNVQNASLQSPSPHQCWHCVEQGVCGLWWSMEGGLLSGPSVRTEQALINMPSKNSRVWKKSTTHIIYNKN